MELRKRSEVWLEAHASRIECPQCGKTVTLRTLRWKHVCGRRPTQSRVLDRLAAEKRFMELEGAALEAHYLRMIGRNGGEAGAERRADQGAVVGA